MLKHLFDTLYSSVKKDVMYQKNEERNYEPSCS